MPTPRMTGHLVALASVLYLAVSTIAVAGPLRITCAVADSLAGSGGPLTVTYDGDATGVVTVASQTVNLQLPATKEVRTGELDGKPHSVTGIRGSGAGDFTMPDRSALEACAMNNTPAEFKDDADLFAMALLSCMKTTPPSAAPVKANASVSIALVPNAGAAPDVVVELTRTYVEKSSVPGGVIKLETFPGQCILEGS